jgi:hypothetical protein
MPPKTILATLIAIGLFLSFDFNSEAREAAPIKPNKSTIFNIKKWFHNPDAVKHLHYNIDNWQLIIQKDGFTGRVSCQLYRLKTLSQGRITYAQETFGFEMGTDDNSLNAWYRIDKSPAKAWQDIYPTLAENRVKLLGGTFENPTGGVVLIPATEVKNAKAVTIRIDQKKAPKRFLLGRFEKAKSAADRLGCNQEQQFERP